MPKYIAIFEEHVCGIPCQVAVTDYTPRVSACVSGPSHNWQEGYGGQGEYVLLDRRGYRAKWLEKHITPEIDQYIQDSIYRELERE